MIVQALHAIQERHGYLPRKELVHLADRIDAPLFRIEEVASFFPHFRKTPPPELEVRICRDMACCLRGSHKLAEQLRTTLKDKPGWSVCEVSCLGRCDRAPAAIVAKTSREQQAENGHSALNGNNGHAHGEEHHEHLVVPANIENLQQVAAALSSRQPPTADSDATFRANDHAKWQIDPYRDAPDRKYAAVKRFLALKTDDDRIAFRKEVISSLDTAGLLGMGGAGGRAFKKWSEVRDAKGDRKYVVCNGDESEPGTFKDRELFLRTPHLIVEGMILGGLVTGAQRGFVYIRHEYPEQIAAVDAEIERAKSQGVCGTNMQGTGFSFDLEVFVSPGGYICGEQTALIEAIEDKRAEPRNRPPELQTNGLWDKPTLLNNVETLGWVPAIVDRDQGNWFAKAGASPDFKGRRFFSISGDLQRPGVYEVPIGLTLGELIDTYCSGMLNGKKLKAVALSGPSGGFLPAMVRPEHIPAALKGDVKPGATHYDLRDVRLDIALFRKYKWMLGAGMVVYGEDADLVEQALACTKFYRNESCGKCVPCRVGCQKLVDVLQKISRRELTAADIEQLKDKDSPIVELTQTMLTTAICGLGTVASYPLTTLLKYFPDEVARYTKK